MITAIYSESRNALINSKDNDMPLEQIEDYKDDFIGSSSFQEFVDLVDNYPHLDYLLIRAEDLTQEEADEINNILFD
tara:strand:- start:4389 stop:4619 length:231 start_codon:yes stop_codon:yes gene_type:complete